MLSSLSIRDVVLIGRLDLEFEDGLGVFTGETGAGKSILLDALGLATGVRAEARLVRQDAERASVSAAFELSDDHPTRRQLAEQGVETAGEPLILRRVLSADGRSRAFANDQAISVGLLSEIGSQLVEVHGQFDSQRLMRPDSHRPLLDAFGGYKPHLRETAAAYATWQDATKRHKAAVEEAAAAQRDEDFLRYSVDELTALAPRPGEEAELADKRKFMMHGEKLLASLAEAQEHLSGGDGTESRIQNAMKALEQVADVAEGRLTDVISTLERGLNEVADGMGQIEALHTDLHLDPAELEAAEERLFALRALARKHNVGVEQLSDLTQEFQRRLSAVEDGAAQITALEKEVVAARQAYLAGGEELRKRRRDAATRIDTAVAEELAGLMLGKAHFETLLAPLDEEDWGPHGTDRVAFQVATNPNAAPGPIHKIASGGEMARFMLALKVVLAKADPVPTMIFDEADAGIGGAVAAAVGDRLALLGAGSQVLVVTHSPQVAAKGRHHWRVSKSETANDDNNGDRVWTRVEPLDDHARQEEIARMLAGARITDEARAAADSLLAGGQG